MIQRDDSGSQANFGKHRLRVTSESHVPDWIDVTQGRRGRENERERETEKEQLQFSEGRGPKILRERGNDKKAEKYGLGKNARETRVSKAF